MENACCNSNFVLPGEFVMLHYSRFAAGIDVAAVGCVRKTWFTTRLKAQRSCPFLFSQRSKVLLHSVELVCGH